MRHRQAIADRLNGADEIAMLRSIGEGRQFQAPHGEEDAPRLVAQRLRQDAALFDRELMADKLYAAFNVWYATGATREIAVNLWQHDSELQLQGAISYAFTPDLVLGVGARYLRAYEGGGLDRFVGDAIFVGPTFSYTLAKSVGISGTWQTQVAGNTGGALSRSLNLDQFERHQALLRLNLHF